MPRMKTYETFDKWAKAQAPKNRKLVERLRGLTNRVAPKLIETSKWGNGCWLKAELPLVFLRAERDHLQFGFFG